MLQFVAMVMMGAMGFAIYSHVEKQKSEQRPPSPEESDEPPSAG